MEKLPAKILIIDDDTDVLYTAKLVLKRHFKLVKTENSPKNILDILQEEKYDVVLLDMNFAPGVTSGQEGLFWLRKIKKSNPETQVILNTAYGAIELAVEGMKQGATDFLLKPWKQEKLVASVTTVYKLSQTKKELTRLQKSRKVIKQELDQNFPPMISESDAMHPVFETIRKVASTEANVLILGENGTGKELVAREIHKQSLRADEAFVKVDLGAIPESLFESELFGHSKGAFTDAQEDRVGRFEVAAGGSLFLDEIGNLSLQLQAKLLTALQSRQITRIGSSQAIPLNVRLICATNNPLYEMIASGTFRQDLLYRINTVEIRIPPLRERKEDIAAIARYYLEVFAEKYNKGQMKLSKSAIKKLETFSWPGNVRELQHAVERAIIMADASSLTGADFPLDKVSKPVVDVPTSFNLENMEKEAIIQAIKKCDGNFTQAAKELGFGRSTLYRKMEKYGL